MNPGYHAPNTIPQTLPPPRHPSYLRSLKPVQSDPQASHSEEYGELEDVRRIIRKFLGVHIVFTDNNDLHDINLFEQGQNKRIKDEKRNHLFPWHDVSQSSVFFVKNEICKSTFLAQVRLGRDPGCVSACVQSFQGIHVFSGPLCKESLIIHHE